jgi:chemotaxis protein CheX
MDLQSTIISATREVFTTMVMCPVVPRPPLPAGSTISCNLSGLLGLAGDLRGTLALHWPLMVAQDVTGKLLGEVAVYPEADITDAMAEVTNMIAGGIKTAFSAEGKTLELSIPSTVLGRSFTIRGSSSSTHLVVPFRVETGEFWVDLKFLETPD